MELFQIVEALIFAAPEPITVGEIQKAVKRAASDMEDAESEAFAAITPKKVEKAIDDISEYYFNTSRPMELIETSTGWRFVTRGEFAEYIQALLPELKPERLSPPALETLALIAYRQPITKGDIEAVRGVSVDGVLNKLIDRGLVENCGRADLPGRPQLYATTELFMEHFEIKDLDDLPNAAELRTVKLPTSEEEEAEGEKESGDNPSEESAETDGETPTDQESADSEDIETEEASETDADEAVSDDAELEQAVDEDSQEEITESETDPDTDEPGATETED
ncbi:MAG: SMC-Scp complex subunit ScpB [Verrucomicrobiota bacterium]